MISLKFDTYFISRVFAVVSTMSCRLIRSDSEDGISRVQGLDGSGSDTDTEGDRQRQVPPEDQSPEEGR